MDCPVTINPSVSMRHLKFQAMYVVRFLHEHLINAIFPEVSELERFQLAKVTFKVIVIGAI